MLIFCLKASFFIINRHCRLFALKQQAYFTFSIPSSAAANRRTRVKFGPLLISLQGEESARREGAFGPARLCVHPRRARAPPPLPSPGISRVAPTRTRQRGIGEFPGGPTWSRPHSLDTPSFHPRPYAPSPTHQWKGSPLRDSCLGKLTPDVRAHPGLSV